MVSGHPVSIKINGNTVTAAYFNGSLVFETQTIDGDISERAVCFSSDQAFTLTKQKDWEGTMEYSNNGTSWSTYTGDAAMTAGLDSSDSKYKVYMRGYDNTVVCSSSGTPQFQFSGNGNLTVSGNLLNLIDYKQIAQDSSPQLGSYCFYKLFYGLTQLLACYGELKMSVMPDYCCKSMFEGCTSLIGTPVISVYVVGSESMRLMFKDCTSLTTFQGRFESMYSVGTNGMAGMFYNSGLVTAPIFAREQIMLQNYALHQMYYGCGSLTTGMGTMNLYSMGEHCCDSMYYNCTALTTGMTLNLRGTIGAFAFYNCYFGCTALTEPGSIAQNGATPGASMFALMYYGCTALEKLPAYTGVLLNVDSACSAMFYNCSKLNQVYTFTSLGSGVNTLTNTSIFYQMFKNTSINIGSNTGSGTNEYKFTTVTLTSSASFRLTMATIDPTATYYTGATIVYAG